MKRRSGLLAAVALCSWPAAAGAGAQSWPVDAGTTAILVEDHRAPLVRLVLEFPGGRWSPWVAGKRAEPAFIAQFSDSRGALRRRADEKAIEVSLQVGEVSATLAVECATADFPAALGLVRDLLANRDLDRRTLRRRAQERKLVWQGEQKTPRARVRRAAAEWLFAPGDPRRQGVERPRPLSRESRDLAAWRDQWIRFPGRVVGLAGDLTRAEAEAAAAGLLPPPSSTTQAGLDPGLLPLKPAETRAPRINIPMPRLTQVYFGLVRPSLDWKDPDYPAFLVADHVLGGHFYSRLSVALRHEGGETYSAGTTGRGGRAVEPYLLWSYTNSAQAGPARAEMRRVLDQFHEAGITDEERAAAAGYLLGRRAFYRQSPAQILDTALEARRMGVSEDFFDRLAGQAAALPTEQVNAFIRRFYRPDLFTPVQAAPPSKERRREPLSADKPGEGQPSRKGVS